MTQRQLVRLDVDGEVAVLVIDNPPVNALSPELAAQIGAALDRFEAEAAHRALVVRCVGRTFVAGGDIAAFDDPDFSAVPINRVLERLERQRRPVVAALHGFVLGGGLELAMACHWRIADPATRLGLPEIRLGLIPGSLGTQRLPRLVGMARACTMITSGDSVAAPMARAWGLVDELADTDIAGAALAYARRQLGRGQGARPSADRGVDLAGVPAGFFAQQRQRAYAQRDRFPAALLLLDALEAAAGPFAAGEVVEARGFELLRHSRESRALRYLFFAQRKAARGDADALQRVGERLVQVFSEAIEQCAQQGVSRARLADALSGFGFGRLPAALAAQGREAPLLDEPLLLLTLLDAVVDAAAQLLEQGLWARASDIDVWWTRELGFPGARGGPLYNADESGLSRVVERLVARGVQPSRLLRRLSQSGARLSEHLGGGPSSPPAAA